ncbi:MAG: hypothetical protein MUC79_00300 [Thiobacillaceae bacterium]|jgi:hypothetical protein|nr:hypothetical protein [Thiobacillaceae bacterium]
MSDRLIRVVVLFIALWLPLQGFAAPLMPFCQHEPIQPAEAMPCHGVLSDQANEAETGQQAGHSDCDGCVLCHMASTAAPICPAPVCCPVLGGDDLPFHNSFYRSHIPEQPGRPPLVPIS